MPIRAAQAEVPALLEQAVPEVLALLQITMAAWVGIILLAYRAMAVAVAVERVALSALAVQAAAIQVITVLVEAVVAMAEAVQAGPAQVPLRKMAGPAAWLRMALRAALAARLSLVGRPVMAAMVLVEAVQLSALPALRSGREEQAARV